MHHHAVTLSVTLSVTLARYPSRYPSHNRGARDLSSSSAGRIFKRYEDRAHVLVLRPYKRVSTNLLSRPVQTSQLLKYHSNTSVLTYSRRVQTRQYWCTVVSYKGISTGLLQSRTKESVILYCSPVHRNQYWSTAVPYKSALLRVPRTLLARVQTPGSYENRGGLRNETRMNKM
eukprot:2721219-Rhodomonas_salina.1